jgi:hypothetical protein
MSDERVTHVTVVTPVTHVTESASTVVTPARVTEDPAGCHSGVTLATYEKERDLEDLRYRVTGVTPEDTWWEIGAGYRGV